MTKDDVIRLAREAGLQVDGDYFSDAIYRAMLERFAKLVAEHEREACAKLAQKTVCDTHIPTGVKIYGTAAAKAIRARGKA